MLTYSTHCTNKYWVLSTSKALFLVLGTVSKTVKFLASWNLCASEGIQKIGNPVKYIVILTVIMMLRKIKQSKRDKKCWGGRGTSIL